MFSVARLDLLSLASFALGGHIDSRDAFTGPCLGTGSPSSRFFKCARRRTGVRVWLCANKVWYRQTQLHYNIAEQTVIKHGTLIKMHHTNVPSRLGSDFGRIKIHFCSIWRELGGTFLQFCHRNDVYCILWRVFCGSFKSRNSKLVRSVKCLRVPGKTTASTAKSHLLQTPLRYLWEAFSICGV